MPRMTVNGSPVEYLMEPDTPLLWALRDASNLTGTKYGCGVGDCGACMVHVDGEALRSCLITIAEAEGRFVTTIEGLSRDRSHPVQQAMVAEVHTVARDALWGGNLVPALIISTFGFGLLQRDGLAILIGWCAIALIGLAALVIWLTWTWVSPYLLPVWAWLNGLLPQAWAWLGGLFGG